MIPQYKIDEIRDQVPIIDIIGRRVTLKKKGSDYVGLCPFHNEKSGSFHVHPVKKFYKCFGCGKSGDAIDFIMSIDGIKFMDAVTQIAKDFNIEIEIEQKEYKKPAPLPDISGIEPKTLEWFRKRGISSATLQRWKITTEIKFVPQVQKERNVICFNHFRDGELINVQHRDGDKNFFLISGAELIFYGLDFIKDEQEAIITEGQIDCLSFYEIGLWRVVSVPNGASKSGGSLPYLDNCYKYFENKEKIYLATDNDLPGLALREELSRRLGKERCWIIEFPEGCKDPNDVLVKHGAESLRACYNNASQYPISGIKTVSDINTEIDNLYTHGYPKTLKLGYPDFDQYMSWTLSQLSIVTGIPSHGKALDIETLIPTPDGFKKMQDLSIGDSVFDERGIICRVINTTEVMYNHECYKLTFDDDTEVIADADHEWLTEDLKAVHSQRNTKKNKRESGRLKPRGTDQTYLKTYPSIKKTRDIASEPLYKDKRFNQRVLLANPLVLPYKKLLVSPYVLGAWLGDGRTDYASITCAESEILTYIEEYGFKTRKQPSARFQYGILGLIGLLKEIKVIGNKHIPVAYLRASFNQRLALLQGLMDTDGYISKNGHCEFTTILPSLADEVNELCSSLGIRSCIKTGNATLNGVFKSIKYRICFKTTLQVFKLKRKKRFISKTPLKYRHRGIKKIEPITSVPVKCISVDSPSHLYLCTKHFIPTHNSEFMDQVYIRLASRFGWKFGIFSAENKPDHIYFAKLAEKFIGKSFVGDRQMSVIEKEAAKKFIGNHFFFINEFETSVTIDGILAKARELVIRKGINGFVIDPWNRLEHNLDSKNENNYIGDCLTEIYKFKEVNNIHFFIVAHPTKILKDPKTQRYYVPTAYNINGSAHWNNRADNILSVYRHFDVENSANEVDVHIQKVRHKWVGKFGTARFQYDYWSGRYKEPDQINYDTEYEPKNIIENEHGYPANWDF